MTSKRTVTPTSTLRLALAGNPNVGKSSLFNALTGSRQHVGNWPGKTVARRSGTCDWHGIEVEVVDLPGSYSLSPWSPEEEITRDVLVDDGVDVVVVVVDATNLERSLYVAAEISELGRPMVVALNMADRADREGIRIDERGLAAAMGAPVVRTVGLRGAGRDALLEAVEARHATGQAPAPPAISYGPEADAELGLLESELAALDPTIRWPRRWLALGLLTDDPACRERLASVAGSGDVVSSGAAARARLEAAGHDATLAVVDGRWSWVVAVAADVVDAPPLRATRADRLDRVLTHRLLGLPILLGVLWVVFKLTTDVAAPFVDWIEGVMTGPVSGVATRGLDALGLDGTWVERLVVDGLIGGVGSVLVFLPVLVVLFTALAVLEDSGYLARAAFVMDRVLRSVGLPGKAFLPLLVGFGCNVPAIYATRVLERRRDRLLTAMVAPFASCAARLPVYVLIAAAVLPGSTGTVVFVMYVLSVVAIVALGGLLNVLFFRHEPVTPFVLELPAYHRPSARLVARKVRQEVGAFLARAGTVILVCAVAVWLLGAIPVRGDAGFGEVDADDSLLAEVSDIVSPVFEPAGFGTWRMTAALLSGFVAKEVVVGTMGQVYGVEDVDDAEPTLPSLGDEITGSVRGLGEATWDAVLAIPSVVGVQVGGGGDAEDTTALETAVRADLDQSSGGLEGLAGAALLLFVLLYVPCMATIGAQRQEIGGRWTAVSVVFSLVVAWVAAVAVFQIGSLLGIGGG